MNDSASARLPWRGGRPPHLPCGPGDVAEDVLLPGDPDRVPLLAKMMDDVADFGRRREFSIVTGTYRGRPLTLCSSGIGGPSTEIALVELARLGVRRVIRIGGMSALVRDIEPGSYLCVTKALGATAVATLYGHPAIAAPGMADALSDAAATLGMPARRGPVASTDSYYFGQDRPVAGDRTTGGGEQLCRFRDQGALGVEMETETVLAVSARLGLSAGALLGAHGNRVTDAWLDEYEATQRNLLPIAGLALHNLDRKDPS